MLMMCSRILNKIRRTLRNIIWYRKFILFKAPVEVFDPDLTIKDCNNIRYDKFEPEFP